MSVRLSADIWLNTIVPGVASTTLKAKITNCVDAYTQRRGAGGDTAIEIAFDAADEDAVLAVLDEN